MIEDVLNTMYMYNLEEEILSGLYKKIVEKQFAEALKQGFKAVSKTDLTESI